jgi:hypothetical protein
LRVEQSKGLAMSASPFCFACRQERRRKYPENPSAIADCGCDAGM